MRQVYYIFILSIFSFSCFPVKSDTEKEVEKSDIKYQISKRMETLNQDTLRKLTLSSAISKYGEPKQREKFNTKEGIISEFRIELLNHFTDEDIKKGIEIEELTWTFDSISNITVWYKIEELKVYPIHILIWDKDSEF